MSPEKVRCCPICGRSVCDSFLSLYDDRYGYAGSFDLLACGECGHKFLDCSFGDAELEELYSRYYPRAALSSASYRPHRQVNGFLSWLNGERRSAYRHVPAGVRVLDIGCGFCETLGYHEARGCEAYGVEADVNVQAVAKEQGFKVHQGVFDPSLYPAGYFDCVTMDQVIEHVSDPLATLAGIAMVLKPGGRAILSTPDAAGWGGRLFGRRWINWHAPYHQHFFSARSMARAAEASGLRLIRADSITSSEWLLYQWNHLFTFPEKGEPSDFWSPRTRRTPGTRLVWLLSRIFHGTKVDHLLTRLFDALDCGDGRLYFLERK